LLAIGELWADSLKIMIKTLITILLLTIGASAQRITAPTLKANPNDKVLVSLRASGVRNIIAFQGVIYYDDAVLQATGGKENNWGCAPGDFIGSTAILCNGEEPGVFYFDGVNPYGFGGRGVLLDIIFDTVKGDSDLDLEDVQFYTSNGPVVMDVVDGSIVLLSAN
jgi:hypothetical protein